MIEEEIEDSYEESGLISTKRYYTLDLSTGWNRDDAYAKFHVRDDPIRGESLTGFQLVQEGQELNRKHVLHYDSTLNGIEHSVVRSADPETDIDEVEGWLPDEMNLNDSEEVFEIVEQDHPDQVSKTMAAIEGIIEDPKYVGEMFLQMPAVYDEHGGQAMRPVYISGINENEHVLRCKNTGQEMYERATELLEFNGHEPERLESRMEEMSGVRPNITPE